MIKDKTLKNLATFLTRFNCSTILTLEQFAWDKNFNKKIPEKSLYIMFFGLKNKKITIDLTFRNHYFYINDFKITATNRVAKVTI